MLIDLRRRTAGTALSMGRAESGELGPGPDSTLRLPGARRNSAYPNGVQLASLAVAGLIGVEAIVALSAYTGAGLILAGLAIALPVLYIVLTRPAAMGYIALGWVVLEKTFEPHLPVSAGTIDTLGDALLIVALVWTLLMNLMRRREPLFTMRHMGLPLLAFIVLGCASAVVNSVPPSVAALGISSTTHSMLIFLVLVNIGIAERDVYRFVYTVIAVLAISCLVAIPQVVASSPAWKLSPTPPSEFAVGNILRVQGIFDHPISLGNYLAMLMPCAIMLLFFGQVRGRKHIVLVFTCLVMLVALVLSMTREAWAALLLSTVILGLTVERQLLRAFVRYILPGIAVLLVLASPLANRIAQTQHGDTRFTLLSKSLPLIRQHFWLGIGPGRFGGHVAAVTHTPVYAQYKMANDFYGTGGQIDQFWTHLMGESGLLGVAAYLMIIVSCFLIGRRAYRESIQPRRKAVILGLLYAIPATVLVSIFSSELETGNSAVTFWALMGVLTVLASRPEPVPKRESLAYE